MLFERRRSLTSNPFFSSSSFELGSAKQKLTNAEKKNSRTKQTHKAPYCPSTRLRVGARRSVLCSTAQIPQLTGVAELTRSEDELSLKPGYAVKNYHHCGPPLRKHARTHATHYTTFMFIFVRHHVASLFRIAFTASALTASAFARALEQTPYRRPNQFWTSESFQPRRLQRISTVVSRVRRKGAQLL